MIIGDRVCHIKQGVGIIEEVGDKYTDIRWLTPDNVPSCCVSTVSTEDLRSVGENVLPQPRSKEWKRKSKEFCDALEGILKVEMGL